MKKIYLYLLIAISSSGFSQEKPVQKPDDNVAFEHRQAGTRDDKQPYNSAGLGVMPEFPGGAMAFQQIFSDRIEVSAFKDAPVKRFRVYVAFVIEEDGTISEEKLIRDPGFGVSDEVLRVLKNITEKWSPGMIKGKPVRCRYNFPVTVEVPKDEK